MEKKMNPKLLEKLRARGETLEEREERRKERRAAKIAAQFGYTADDNPFHDPNIAESFTWKKKTEKLHSSNATTAHASAVSHESKANQQDANFLEIQKVRMRRKLAEERKEELERIKMEESRLQQYEQYDAWAQKEEQFHLQQLKLKSATRLVQGREKPIDVLAKNLILFALSTQQLSSSNSLIKYKEKYNVLEELDATLDVDLQEPHLLLRHLKLNELQELLQDIISFQSMERLAMINTTISNSENIVLQYWDALAILTQDEIHNIQLRSMDTPHATTTIMESIQNMLQGQSKDALEQMKTDIQGKLQLTHHPSSPAESLTEDSFVDVEYWTMVLHQVTVLISKIILSEIHERMLVSQLDKLEKRKERRNITIGATAAADEGEEERGRERDQQGQEETNTSKSQSQDLTQPWVVHNTHPNTSKPFDQDFGSLEEELGLVDEVDLSQFLQQENSGLEMDRNRPRKPRYFNRVKTGYDWNKYNQTHYDHDNPPPRVVQGYKFNIFYPDLIDRTKTPQFFLEPADSTEFCIIRFHAGPPYEDVAFKIINQEWNRSRKHGYRCFFERGVLSLYFNFKSHWYRR